MYAQNQINQKLAASTFDPRFSRESMMTASECEAMAQGTLGGCPVSLPLAAEAASRVDSQLVALQGSVDRLLNKIAPVLLPAPPEQTKDGARPAAGAPLLEVFAQISDRLRSLERQIEGAYDRLVV